MEPKYYVSQPTKRGAAHRRPIRARAAGRKEELWVVILILVLVSLLDVTTESEALE
jgi:hypothetical protein